MYDPLQSYQTSAFGGGATPFGLPYGNPISALYQQFAGNPLAGMQGGGYGIHQQQPWQQLQQLQQLHQLQQLQQLQQQIQQLQNPLAQGVQNPFTQGLQNPLTQGLHNPILQGLHNPLQFQNPMIGYQPWNQQQFGYPLAPQSLIGGAGQGFGQIHPLAAQLALRGATAGISPWGY